LVAFGNRNIFDEMQFQEAIVMDIKISTYYIPMQGRKWLPQTRGKAKVFFFLESVIRFSNLPISKKIFQKNCPELEI
jgi:hypothetical protein